MRKQVSDVLVRKVADMHFEGDTEKATQYLQRCIPCLQSLAALIEGRFDHRVVQETDYDSPSWSHKQAHLNGKIEALTLVLSLLPADQP